MPPHQISWYVYRPNGSARSGPHFQLLFLRFSPKTTSDLLRFKFKLLDLYSVDGTPDDPEDAREAAPRADGRVGRRWHDKLVAASRLGHRGGAGARLTSRAGHPVPHQRTGRGQRHERTELPDIWVTP